jgi:hypothetical protein
MNNKEFKYHLIEKAKENRRRFENQYHKVLDELKRSQAEIELLFPDLTCRKIYQQLINVVKEASLINLEQAKLKIRIQELGEVGVNIANKIPSLAKLLV